MSQVPSVSDDLLSAAALLRVDEACARFEDSWKKGQRPRLEAFLDGTHDPERTELLRELLRLERHYRQNLGEPVAAHEYEGRFPEDITLIRSVLAEGMTVDPAAAGGTGPEAAPQEPRGGVVPSEPRFPTVPGYEILAELGRGGMGVVYQARHTALKRLVALKMILAADYASREQLDRFQREAEAVARLRHPNIVQIHEVGEMRGCPFFSLEFVEGGSLARHIGGTPQPPRQAADLIATLARAMHAAHQAGVVHRDLKPANILLSFSGRSADKVSLRDGGVGPAPLCERPLNEAVPKITDFGLAKRLDGESEHTHTGVIMGTPSYMAPEQAEGRARDVGPAADVYALAAILYEMLTGRPPFKGASVRDTIEQVCTREPVPPTQLQPKVPRDLETICLKGLRKEARQRYTTAQDLADDLQRWLEGRPIVARPVPGWERAWKWARRRPALAGLAAAVLVALLAGTASAVLYGLYQQQKAEAGEREANQKAEAREREAKGSRTIQDLVAAGYKAETDGQFGKAQQHYGQALATLNAEPGAASDETRRLLQGGIDRVSEQLKEQGRKAERHEFALRRERFHYHYDEVQFRSVHFGDQSLADDAAAVRKEAPEALKQLDLDPNTPEGLAQGLEHFRPFVDTPDQLKRLAEECVEVLLAWADAEPKQALRLLAGAATVCQAHGLGTFRALHRRAKAPELPPGANGARAAWERADGIAPTTALDHFDAALRSYRAGHVAEASAACARVLQLRSDHFWAQYLQALCYLQDQRWGEAEVGLNVCLGRKPGLLWLFPLLGIAHMGLKDYPAAEADFAKALQASSHPALRAAALTNRSTMRRNQGKLDDAESDLREAIKLQPEGYQAYANLAYLLEDRGDRQQALKMLDKAQALSPANTTLHSERARLRAQSGDLEGARADFKQVITREPPGSKSDRVPAARVELARLCILERDYKAALAHCEAVLKARPNFPPAHRQHAHVLLALGRKKEAGEALDRYLKLGGEPTAAVYRARGLIHAEQRDHRAAVVSYSQALLLRAGQMHLQGFAAQSVTSLATLDASSGMKQLLNLNAFALLRKEDAETLTSRGWAYLALEAVRPALEDFDAALKLNPQSADALAGWGTALVLRGGLADVAKATAAAEESLRSEARTSQRLIACARIYTRAAGVLEPTPRRWPLDTQAERYRQRALELLRQAKALVPEKKQPAFWRDSVLGDPALQPLLRIYGR
jgi:tetratricopeptide (TPR) repeat protein